MSLSDRQARQLAKILHYIHQIKLEDAKTSRHEPQPASRRRRTKAAAEKMRQEVLAALARGQSAKTLAQKCGVTTAYIYMIKASQKDGQADRLENRS